MKLDTFRVGIEGGGQRRAAVIGWTDEWHHSDPYRVLGIRFLAVYAVQSVQSVQKAVPD